MSASDRWGTYETPCPNCGDKVEYWYFAPDCSYNPGSSGIQCKGCKRNFTYEEWCKIAAKEMKPELDRRKKAEQKYNREKKLQESIRKKALFKLTPKEKKTLGIE